MPPQQPVGVDEVCDSDAICEKHYDTCHGLITGKKKCKSIYTCRRYYVKDTTTSSINRCVFKTVLGGKMQCVYRYHLKQGDYMTTSNLGSGYWHIPLHEE